MTTLQTNESEPIAGTGEPAQAGTETHDLTVTTAATRRERYEHRIVATIVTILGTILFVSCVRTDLACAEVLSKILVQQQHRIQAVARAQAATPAPLTPTGDS